MDIVCVTIDCHDARALAAFWSEALGWPKVRIADDGSGAHVSRVERGLYLELIRVPEDKAVKNRVHLGCHVDPVEALDAELDRLLALGASVAWEEEFPPEVAQRYRNIVLRDPEGNEFCLGAGSYK